MADSFLDHLPSHEQRKLKRMMSPEAYERLRENVKGPEDLEREMERNTDTAEAKFTLESEPHIHDRVKSRVEADMREKGAEQVIDGPVSPEHKAALEQGKFRLTVSAHPFTHQDQLTAVPEGKVQEKLPIKPALSEGYMAQLQAQAD